MSLKSDFKAGEGPELQAIEAGMIGVIADWCECLHGKGIVRKALTSLQASLGAEIVALTRTNKAPDGMSRAIHVDISEAGTGRQAPLRAYARSVLGPYFDKARPGTTWHKSLIEEGRDPALEAFQTRRRLSELVVIPLESGPRHLDAIEFHFKERPRPYTQAVLNMLATTLARTWRNRAPGQFTEALLKREASKRAERPSAPILSMDNPAQLSRAEFRVCLLLSRGKSTEQIRGELTIGESTLRTHLRNIYAKTQAHNMSELVYLLASVAPFGSAGGGHSGRVA